MLLCLSVETLASERSFLALILEVVKELVLLISEHGVIDHAIVISNWTKKGLVNCDEFFFTEPSVPEVNDRPETLPEPGPNLLDVVPDGRPWSEVKTQDATQFLVILDLDSVADGT